MDYKKDIEWLGSLTEEQGKKEIDKLVRTLPDRLEEWPRTFPASIDPKLILIGVSPGGSPSKEVNENDYNGHPSVFKSVDKKPYTNFLYPDENGYWDKVRMLINNFFSPELDEREKLSLTTHYNLGTNATGNPSKEDVDEDIISWVSTLLNNYHKPDLVILFGLKGILQDEEIGKQWNHDEGLEINWNRPHFQILFKEHEPSRYYFRGWEVTNGSDKKFNVVIWPNHPSRIPFGADKMWDDAVNKYLSVLVGLNIK